MSENGTYTPSTSSVLIRGMIEIRQTTPPNQPIEQLNNEQNNNFRKTEELKEPKFHFSYMSNNSRILSSYRVYVRILHFLSIGENKGIYSQCTAAIMIRAPVENMTASAPKAKQGIKNANIQAGILPSKRGRQMTTNYFVQP
ncbi:hypothetical protein G9A89_002585 [Geosiphon pyriformis]|nr:hypothetical protein G9A89_002585 [Geosiphon pyriformis]